MTGRLGMRDDRSVQQDTVRRGSGKTISFVVATLNCRSQVAGLVRCFRECTDVDAELVIVDGASTDGTPEWLAEEMAAGQHERIAWCSMPDRGIADAWNRGVGLASGRWLLFLGADDRLSSEPALRSAIESLRAVSDAVWLVAFPVMVVSPSGVPVATVIPRLHGADAFPATSSLPHQGVFHRRDIWQRLGTFDTALAIASDYEFLVRAWAAGINALVLESAPPPVRMCFGGLSKQSPLRNLREFRAVRRRYGVPRGRVAEAGEWLKAAARLALVTTCGCAVADSITDRVRELAGRPRCWTVK
jgi:GT2 family glycosyltransferase